MKKGFTLIELLSVVIILALICLLAIPAFLAKIRDTKEELSGAMSEILFNATSIYVENKDYKKNEGDIYCVTIKELVDNNLINTPVKDPVTKDEIPHNRFIKVTVNGGDYDYEFTNSCTEIISNLYDKIDDLVYDENGCDTSKAYSYMDGCYIKANASTDLQNHVWYNGFLWRAMGINSDNSIKLVMEENITSIPYNTSGNINFNNSHVDDWLNNYFYNKLDNNLKEYMVKGNFCQGVNTTSSSNRGNCENGKELNRYVGLLSIDEYNLAGGSNSYLKNSQYFRTMSPYNASYIWDVDNDGNAYNNSVTQAVGIRPVINLHPNSKITAGDGTLGNFYVIEESKKIINIATLSSVKIGEYVSFNDKIYRVVENGTTTKLILDGYYQENNAKYLTSFGNSNTFSTSSGIGNKLNNDVLNWLTAGFNQDEFKNAILNSNWYQNKFDYGNSYTVSLDESNTPIQAKVGLIRIGEMLSGTSYTMLTNNGTVLSNYNNAISYWTMTPDISNLFVWDVYCYGFACSTSVSNTDGVRPVINVSSNLELTGGTGLPTSPYVIGLEKKEDLVKAPGLYQTGTNYGTLLKSWDELISEGIITANGKAVADKRHLLAGDLIISDEIPAIYGDDISPLGLSAFEDCTNLTGVIIPSSVTIIYGEAFRGCTNLTSVIFEEGSQLTEIRFSAFEDCTSLINIEIPANVTYIGALTFANCTSLVNIEIPEGVTIIHGRTFQDCTNLTSVKIPSSVATIKNASFTGCTNLASVKIAEGSQLTTIGPSAFKQCISLVSIEIPASVTVIGTYVDDGVFEGCTNLTTVIFVAGSQLESIGKNTFYNCISLVNIEIPESVTIIEYDAFSNCKSLTSIEIPKNVTIIGGGSFADCTSLIRIDIPISVTTIEYDAFSGCTKLATINYAGTMEQWNKIEKDNNWNSEVPATKVICSDGTVALN